MHRSGWSLWLQASMDDTYAWVRSCVLRARACVCVCVCVCVRMCVCVSVCVLSGQILMLKQCEFEGSLFKSRTFDWHISYERVKYIIFNVCVWVCVYVCMCVSVCAQVCECVHEYACACLSMYAHVCACTFVCVCRIHMLLPWTEAKVENLNRKETQTNASAHLSAREKGGAKTRFYNHRALAAHDALTTVHLHLWLARTECIHHIWPYVWWLPCQKIPHIYRVYMVLANPT